MARGALRFEDYQAYIPGLSTISIAPGYSQIQIRGLSTGINQLSATVGTYFDESPSNSSTSNGLGNRLTPDPDLFDVRRIEVLRGPPRHAVRRQCARRESSVTSWSSRV